MIMNCARDEVIAVSKIAIISPRHGYVCHGYSGVQTDRQTAYICHFISYVSDNIVYYALLVIKPTE